MAGPVTYTKGEGVQVAIGKRWLDARVEEIIDPDFVRIRLCTGRQNTMTMPASSDRLRKWGDGKVAVSKPGPGRWKGQARKRWSDALVKRGK